MSIRVRLVIMCLAIALLPAIPLSLLVHSLLEKSFNVGLSDSVEDALKSGSEISRKHLDGARLSFEEDVREVVSQASEDASGRFIDSTIIAAAYQNDARVSRESGGFFIAQAVTSAAGKHERARLPRALIPFSNEAGFNDLLGQKELSERRTTASAPGDITFYETTDRSILFALWRPGAHGSDRPPPATNTCLFYVKIDPEFLAHAERLIVGRQIFAQLRLEQGPLSRSFFYPFIIIYGAILLFSLVLAFVMAERLAAPIRRLVRGTRIVAGGDWGYRLRSNAHGEIGHLVDAFNAMVARLESQRKRLIDMEKMAAWREIARRLAHEIKNPLLPIRLTIEELKDQYKGEDKQYEEMLSDSARVVGDELNSLQKLVKEFSSFAKMPEMSPRTASLARLVHDVAKLYPGVSVQIDCNPALSDFPFDPDQMRRVLVNLFDNSIAAMGGRSGGAIRIKLDCMDHEAVIEFSDNGPGIPADTLPKIFDPYFTSKSEGTGLGLAMVKNIILLHGGSIDAESSEGKGTTFIIAIPMRRDET